MLDTRATIAPCVSLTYFSPMLGRASDTPDLPAEIARRRTFAIVSHPADAAPLPLRDQPTTLAELDIPGVIVERVPPGRFDLR